MISLKEYCAIYEGATKTRINNQWVIPGQTIISANPYHPDKPDWELKFIERDGKSIRGTNCYGVITTVPIDKVKEIIPMEKQPKEKQQKELSPKQIQNIKYKIADLESNLMELMRDMENEPGISDEAEAGGGPITDRYAKEMNKLQNQIDKLYDKLNSNIKI